MKNIKLFEEYLNSINRWTNKIISDERFYEWLDENEDMLKQEYNTYLIESDKEHEKPLSFKNWTKEYYDNL